MKILIISFLIFSSGARAQDAVNCATKASNLALAIKAKAFISSQLESVVQNHYKGKLPENYQGPYQDPQITTEKICAGLESSQWEEVKQQKKISLKLLTQEIKNGKISKTIASGIDENTEKDMTPKELCASLSKATDNMEYLSDSSGTQCQETAKKIHTALSNSNYLDKSFGEVCKDLYPKLKDHHNKMADCRKGNKPEVKEVKAKINSPEQVKLPGVDKGSFKYLKPTGATAQ